MSCFVGDNILDVDSGEIDQGEIEHDVLVMRAGSSFRFCFPNGESMIGFAKFLTEKIESFFGVVVENFF